MTSLANYDNDPTIFFTRPISGSIMAFSMLFVVWALVPGIGGMIMRRLMPNKNKNNNF
jgi:putative tricarboxylic transport membrane protein